MLESLNILEVAQQIKKLTECEIKVTEDKIDKRNYKVSSNKFNQLGFKPQKNIEVAFNEIKKAFEEKTIENYKDVKYNNYEFLFSSKEMQEKVFIQGI